METALEALSAVVSPLAVLRHTATQGAHGHTSIVMSMPIWKRGFREGEDPKYF